MEAQEFNELLPDYILGKLTESQNSSFKEYLTKHPEAAATVEAWNEVENFEFENPVPSAQMDHSFYSALRQEMDRDTKEYEVIENSDVNVISMRPWKKRLFQSIAAAAILLVGFLIGNTIGSENGAVIVGDDAFAKAETQSIQEAENETEAVRSQLVIALADQPSASKRLQAVSEVNKMSNATDQVIVALFKMLNSDPNVNVRLAAVTSLSKYVDNPKVREGLVMSITKQESPLVQLALAELMVTLKEQKSIDSMETLLQQPDINAAVKLKLEESIKRII